MFLPHFASGQSGKVSKTAFRWPKRTSTEARANETLQQMCETAHPALSIWQKDELIRKTFNKKLKRKCSFSVAVAKEEFLTVKAGQ